MSSRSCLLIALLFSLAFLFAVPAYAGGWAVITLDHLPTDVNVNQPINVGFTVLQHGKTPMTDLDPTITAELSDTDSFVVHAKPDGKPGHYAATLTFPKAGKWSWKIFAFTMQLPMPALDVSIGDQLTTRNGQTTSSTSPLWIIRLSTLVIGIVGLVFAWKNNNRKALALTSLCLVVGLGSFVTGSAVPEAKAQINPSAKAAPLSQVEMGQQLFIAKGCVTCHVNHKVSNDSAYWTIDMGAPDLSKFSADPGYLDKWLFNPSALKPATQMPNLHLSDDERTALIAFINSK